MTLAKRHVGTNSRRVFDARKIGEGLRYDGIDTRHWVSHATVATVGDDGEPDYTDKRAVFNAPAGVEVDVILEPLGLPCTCLYSGIQGGGEAIMMAPIRPGDRVLVVLPDGGTQSQPVIVAILNSSAVKVPLESDQKPIFRNDRVLLHAKSVDIDIRTAGGTQVEVKQNGTVNVKGTSVNLGASDATEQVVKGNQYTTAEQSFLNAFATWVDTINAGFTGADVTKVPGAPAAVTGCNVFKPLLQNFKPGNHLSSVTRTK